MPDPIYGNTVFDKSAPTIAYRVPGQTYNIPNLNVSSINGSTGGGGGGGSNNFPLGITVGTAPLLGQIKPFSPAAPGMFLSDYIQVVDSTNQRAQISPGGINWLVDTGGNLDEYEFVFF